METIRGRTALKLDLNGFKQRLADYKRIVLDLGTGDGRYARSLAEKHSSWFIIGVDACRENLRENSQVKIPNLLFLIASAQDLPHELDGSVSHIAINFPWGSLMESLLTGDPMLLRGLQSVSQATASLDVRSNGGALVEAGTTLEAGTAKIYENLFRSGWQVKTPVMLDAHALKTFPSTWAKRLAFGRDPRAVMLRACLK
ncbi:MAG TPA: class I SAM-dependent methyltransferase [Anaerolineales bacterium]|nr:class I SAM-dependent methyltransferase [Anaerolineales bacterium]